MVKDFKDVGSVSKRIIIAILQMCLLHVLVETLQEMDFLGALRNIVFAMFHEYVLFSTAASAWS